VAYYLGIDGGGTKTVCAVGDETSLLATATAGPSNIVRVGEEEARRSLHQAIGQACAAAGISPQEVARTCIGAAGAGNPEIIALIARALNDVVGGEIQVTGDMQIALEAAFPGAPGIIVIAGTGSIVYGRDAQGNAARAGGWGFAVSDEGSAHWIGRNAVAAILRARDLLQARRQLSDFAEPDGSLFGALQQTWNLNSLDDLVRAANATPPPNFATLLPAVVSCADAGDDLSRQVLTRAAAELAQLAAIIIPRLFPQGPDASVVARLAMAGGVFRHSDLVRRTFYNELRNLYSCVDVCQQVVDPVEGALRMARLV
jgi:glucosamine kinase